jgi:O-antigen/teichoic acid export membrane protein
LGIVIRQSFWNTAVSYFGVLLGAINVIWLFPTLLGDVQFGVTRLLLSGSLIAAQFAQLGMGNVTYRFFPQFQDPENGHRGFLRILLIVPLLGFVLCVGIFFIFQDAIASFFVEKAPLFVAYDAFLIPLVAFTLYFNVLDAWLRSVYRTVSGSFVREVVLRLLQTAAVLMYAMGWFDFYGFVIAFVGVHGIATAILLLWTVYAGEFSIRSSYAPPFESTNKDMRSYALYAIMGGISAIAVANLDLLMVGGYLGEASAGYYAIAFFIGTFISIPERSITKISYPIISQAFKDDNKDLIATMYKKSSLNQIVIGLLIFIGIWANVDNAVVLLPDGFAVARNVMIIISAAKLIDMATGANSIILLNSPWYRFDLVTNILLVGLTIITNLLLIPIYGLDGAAWATFITITVYNLVKFVYIWIKMGIQPFEVPILKALFAGVVAFLVSLLLPTLSNVWVDLIIRSLIISLVYGIIVLKWTISDDINRIFGKIVLRFTSK